ncbi:MAG: glutaminyl-peptide cyclotransferase [Nevskiaceae bacterium]|nr:MAG: glutaminyl-peptide cyclotransferase [Nevskiaceae bacterium]TBR75127.1 MAG: glutaminyl-peptide cyclotransferase [Nevskiaceae bacterium]
MAVALLVGAVAGARAAPVLGWRVVATYPHSTSAFTQGLAVCNGNLVESDGLYGRSRIEVRTLHTGRVLASQTLPATVFAEGATCAAGRILQLTWREGVAFAYDENLNLLQRYVYPREGWGLAFDGTALLASDGSAKLYRLNPDTFATTGRLVVRDAGVLVSELNELEYAQGSIWANVWHTNRIARIDPATGNVTGWLDLARLAAQAAADPRWVAGAENVLNGIAFDPDSRHFFVTGKDWPTLFEIALDATAGGGGHH